MGQACRKSQKGETIESPSSKLFDKKFIIKIEDLTKIIEEKGNAQVLIKENYGSIQEMQSILKTSFNSGLSDNEEELQARKVIFGSNFIPPKKPKTFFSLILEALKDYTIIILLFCLIIIMGVSIYSMLSHAGGNNEWKEGVAILAAVVIVVLTTAGNDYHKEKQFRSLQKKIERDQKVTVIRHNENIEILCSDIVVGEICVLKYGDVIPADGILIQSSDLFVDESQLTGESDLVKKTTNGDVIVIGGTHVMEGSGRMVVLSVGVNSQAGIIFSMLGVAGDKAESSNVPDAESGTAGNGAVDNADKSTSEESEESSSVLQSKLNRIAILIAYVGTACAISILLVLLGTFCYREYISKKESFKVPEHILEIMESLVISITVFIVAVPEGLPLAVTLSLAYSIKRMLKDNNMVRHLSACETMGNATVICSDKTGTLTTNRMTAVELYMCNVHHNTISEAKHLPIKLIKMLCRAVAVNSSYSSKIVDVGNEQLPLQMGNKTECGLLGLVLAFGESYDEIRKEFPEESFLKVFTFNSARKSMSTIIKEDKAVTAYIKGAAETILERSSWSFDSKGDKIALSNENKKEINTTIDTMANNGLRTIGVAFKPLSGSNPPTTNASNDSDKIKIEEKELVSDLILIAIVGIMDPVRDEVPSSIKICQRAGISVRMVTGDNINTARSIAKRCGILTEENSKEDLIMESKEFNRLIRNPDNQEISQEKLDKIWPKLKVLARSSPQDKYILVSGIIKSRANPEREIVAVTGDGTNDGPALKVADVGFAMGQAGTDVAKEASDIILLDDNFTSIVKAVMWGRNVYDSISKFLQFQMTVNAVSLISTLVSVSITGKPPIQAVQMLWINLIMDTLASLALATEQPTEELLNRKPYGRQQSLLSPLMIRNISMHSVYQIIVLHVIIFAGPSLFDFKDGFSNDDNGNDDQQTEHSCLVFSTFVFMTLFNEINSRKVDDNRNTFKGIFANLFFPIIWLGSSILQVIISEFGGSFLKTHPLTIELWGWCFFFGIGTLLWHQIVLLFSKELLQRLLSSITVSGFKKSTTESFNNVENKHCEAKNEPLTRAQWVRGINRIQTQISVVRGFEKSVDRAIPSNEINRNNSQIKQESPGHNVIKYL